MACANSNVLNVSVNNVCTLTFPWFVWCRGYCLKSSILVNFSTSSTSKNFAWLNLVCDSWTVLLRMRPPLIFFLGVYCSFGDCACADPSMSNSHVTLHFLRFGEIPCDTFITSFPDPRADPAQLSKLQKN
jgi:hypothetical protein